MLLDVLYTIHSILSHMAQNHNNIAHDRFSQLIYIRIIGDQKVHDCQESEEIFE